MRIEAAYENDKIALLTRLQREMRAQIAHPGRLRNGSLLLKNHKYSGSF
jgi:hypothetical protein